MILMLGGGHAPVWIPFSLTGVVAETPTDLVMIRLFFIVLVAHEGINTEAWDTRAGQGVPRMGVGRSKNICASAPRSWAFDLTCVRMVGNRQFLSW